MVLTQDVVKSSPLGYPQFSTLMGVHPDFSVFRRFSVTRARLLLQKQQRVSELEMQLEELDSQEPRPLYLGSFQADANASRLQVLKDLDKALADYGKWYTKARLIPSISEPEAVNEKSVESEDVSNLSLKELCKVCWHKTRWLNEAKY